MYFSENRICSVIKRRRQNKNHNWHIAGPVGVGDVEFFGKHHVKFEHDFVNLSYRPWPYSLYLRAKMYCPPEVHRAPTPSWRQAGSNTVWLNEENIICKLCSNEFIYSTLFGVICRSPTDIPIHLSNVGYTISRSRNTENDPVRESLNCVSKRWWILQPVSAVRSASVERLARPPAGIKR